MYEVFFYPSVIHLSQGILSFFYYSGFLSARRKSRSDFLLWCAVYFCLEMGVLELLARRLEVHNDLLEILIDIIFQMFLQLCFFCKDVSKQLFLTASFLSGKYLLKTVISVVSNAIMNVWSINDVGETRMVLSLLLPPCMALSYAVLFVAYLRFIEIAFSRRSCEQNIRGSLFLLVPCITSLGFYVLSESMVDYIENAANMFVYDTIPATNFWMPFICVMLLFSIIANVALFQNIVFYEDESRKRVILENQIDQMRKEVAEIEDIYADMRGLRHDMRNHINDIMLYIRGLEGADTKDIDAYIGQMEKTISRLDLTYKSGNPITDIIIHKRQQEAERKHIDFDVDFIYPREQIIDVYDIAVILNNALENAFDACSQVSGKREVHLHSYTKGDLFFIEVENDFTGELIMNEVTGLPESGKQDKKLHGIGLSNIQRCAGKYLGDIDIEIKNEDERQRFSLTVMMCGSISHLK